MKNINEVTIDAVYRIVNSPQMQNQHVIHNPIIEHHTIEKVLNAACLLQKQWEKINGNNSVSQ